MQPSARTPGEAVGHHVDRLAGESTDVAAPELTIAVPFYSGAEFLRRTIESIFGQPPSNWAALLVDNSVDEREHQAAQALAAQYPPSRLRYVRNPVHLNACDNFNRCIDLAETDLVSTVHGDDEVLPCYAQEISRLAKSHLEAAVLLVPVQIIDENSRPRFSFVDWFKQFLKPRSAADFVLSDERSLTSILAGNWVNGAAVCYRKSALGELRWESTHPMASDFELWSRVILSGRLIAGASRPPSYCYRRHAGQTTARLSANLERFRDESQALDAIADRADAHGWHSAASVARAKRIVQLHLIFLMSQDLARGLFARAGQKLRLLREIRASARHRSNDTNGNQRCDR